MGDFDEKEFEPLGIILRIPAKGRRKLMEGRDQLQPAGRRRPSGGSGGRGMATIRRLVAKAPEVMVKVSGGARGAKGVREHLYYITRNGELVADTPSGDLVGKAEVAEAARAWWENRGQAQGAHRRNSRETVNLVLSMPPGTDRDKLTAAARLFASRTFGANHDYLLVEHRDTDHPHVHLTVRSLGHDMTRLNPKKADLQAWREGLAVELRAQGIEAVATPRRARGVVRKSKRQAIHHLDARGDSRVQRSKVAELLRELTQKVAAGEDPFAQAAKWKQKQIRAAWGRLADQCDAEGGEGVALGLQIREFIKAMTPIATERDALREVVAREVSQQRRGGGGERGGGGRGDDGRER